MTTQETEASSHLRDISSGAVIALALKAVAFLGSYLLTIVVARKLGPADAGQFFLLLALVTVLSTVLRLGFDKPLVRQIAHLYATKRQREIGTVVFSSFVVIAAVSLPAAAALWFLAAWLSGTVFAMPGLQDSFRLMTWAIPALALTGIVALAFQGLQRIALHLFFLSALTPFLMLVIVGFANARQSTASLAAWYSTASVMSLAAATLAWTWLQRQRVFRYDRRALTPVISASRVTFVVVVGQLAIGWAPVLLLGALSSSFDVAVYHVADRTALLIGFVLIAVNVVAAPKFAALHSTGRSGILEQTVRRSTWIMTGAALPLAAVFVTFPDRVLALFGDGFGPSAMPLRILAIGQLVATATGSVANLLLMTGHEREFRNLILIGAAVNFAVGAPVIARFGAVGAAIVTTAAMVLVNLLAAVVVRRRLGFWGLGAPSTGRESVP